MAPSANEEQRAAVGESGGGAIRSDGRLTPLVEFLHRGFRCVLMLGLEVAETLLVRGLRAARADETFVSRKWPRVWRARVRATY